MRDALDWCGAPRVTHHAARVGPGRYTAPEATVRGFGGPEIEFGVGRAVAVARLCDAGARSREDGRRRARDQANANASARAWARPTRCK